MKSHGSVAVVVCVLAFLLMLAGLAVADAGVFLLARARAQAAADAAALAAVVEQIPILASGEDPAKAADFEARRNGAVVTGCRCEPGTASATVTVSIAVHATFLPGWSDRRVAAAATASAGEWLLTYRR